MERKLATIRTVTGIAPIADADKIELAHLDGWQCVVKKGEFKAGEQAVYFEIDSYLPVEPRYEFLRKTSYKKQQETGEEGFRLKTMKMRGALSQGLALPVSAFMELQGRSLTPGCDVTELLKIRKYEPPVPSNLAGQVLGAAPSYLRKTDQERIQNLPEYFDQFKEVEFEITEKLDGTSCTVYFRDGAFGVCGRNYELKEDEINTMWVLARALNLKRRLEEFRETESANLALQGEIVGPGIQGNPYKLKEARFYLFDIWDIGRQQYLNAAGRSRVHTIIKEAAGDGRYEHVPVLAAEKIFQTCPTLEDLLARADFPSRLNPQAAAEGMVLKSREAVGGILVSFKTVNNRYLLGESQARPPRE